MLCYFLLVAITNHSREGGKKQVEKNKPRVNACRVLKGGVFKGRVFLGNPKDSGREDWGTLGKIRGISTPGPWTESYYMHT